MKTKTFLLLPPLLAAALATSDALAQSRLVRNPSFELNYNDTWPHYSAADEWNGASGINEASGPFHNNGTPIPDGRRVGFKQGSGTVSQDISGLTANKQYWVQFQYDARNCCGGTIDIVVKWNDVELGKIANVRPVEGGASYRLAAFAFTPDADAGTLTLQTVASGDATANFDGVNVVQRDAGQAIVANPSFEASGNVEGDGVFVEQAIGGWVGTGAFGVHTAGFGSTGDNGAVPDQDNAAFLTGPSSLSQTIRNLKIGSTVKVTYSYNAKSGNSPRLQVKHGEAVIGADDVTPVGGTNPYRTKTVTFVAADTAALVTFEQTKDGQTVLLDNIKVEAETIQEFKPLAFAPTGLELAPGQSATVTLSLDPEAVKTKAHTIKLRSPNAAVARLVGADADGLVTLEFPKGGKDSATFQIEAAARGVVRIESPETSGLRLGEDVAVNVVSSYVRNSSFESNPAAGGIGAGPITAWTGGTGLNKDAGPFHDNGEIPDRDQVAVLQGNNRLSQQITGLEGGKSYWLQFRYNARNCCGGTIGLTVNFDGKEIAKINSVTPVLEKNPYSFHSTTFTPATTGGLLEFVTAAQGDATVLLDAVSIVQRDAADIVIENSSFEATGNPVGVGYVQPRKIAGWTQTGGYGVNITGLGPFSDNGVGPDQDRVLFMQGPGSLVQTLTGLTPNQPHTLIYSVNARNCCGAGATRYSVSFADVAVVEETEVAPVGAGMPYAAQYVVFTPAAAEGELRFTTAPEGDHTLLLDNIRIVKGVVTKPVAIGFSIDGPNLRLTWPADDAAYKLESTTAFPGGWAADNTAITQDGALNVASVPIGNGRKMYRLKK